MKALKLSWDKLIIHAKIIAISDLAMYSYLGPESTIPKPMITCFQEVPSVW